MSAQGNQMRSAGSLWMGGAFGACVTSAIFCFSRGQVIGLLFLLLALVPLGLYIAFGTVLTTFEGKAAKELTGKERELHDINQTNQAVRNIVFFIVGLGAAIFLFNIGLINLVIDQS